jgi:methionine-rich copper-binding protein CopC
MKNFLLSGLIAFWATGAIAHSPLDETTPANEAIVSEMPTEVLMEFKGDSCHHSCFFRQHGHGSRGTNCVHKGI